MTQAFVQALKLSAGFWRNPRAMTRRWRTEGIPPGRVTIDPPEPGTFKLYLVRTRFDTDVEAAHSARTAHVD